MYVTYCHTSIKIWNLTPETQLSIAFLPSFNIMLNCCLYSQEIVLHAYSRSEMVLNIFTIPFFFFWGGGGGLGG